jgi:hypothetical protein
MMNGMKTDGRSFFKSIFVKGSKRAYEMKKTVREMLYWLLVIFRSMIKPSSFALPMLVLSKKEMRSEEM